MQQASRWWQVTLGVWSSCTGLIRQLQSQHQSLAQGYHDTTNICASTCVSNWCLDCGLRRCPMTTNHAHDWTASPCISLPDWSLRPLLALYTLQMEAFASRTSACQSIAQELSPSSSSGSTPHSVSQQAPHPRFHLALEIFVRSRDASFKCLKYPGFLFLQCPARIFMIYWAKCNSSASITWIPCWTPLDTQVDLSPLHTQCCQEV